MTTLVVRRLYFYLAAFIGLQILASGLGTILALLLERLFWPGAIADIQLSVNRLSLSIALVVVGLPLWAVHWGVIHRGHSRPEEQASVLRRLYGYAVLLVAMFGLLAALRTLLLAVFGAFDATSVAGVPSPSAEALAALSVNVSIWGYHWRIIGRDRVPIEMRGGTAVVRRWYLVLVEAVTLAIASYSAVDLLHQLLRRGFGPGIGDPSAPRLATASLIAALVVWLPHHLWSQSLVRNATPLRSDELACALRQVYAALVVTAAGVAALGGLVVLLGAALLALFGGATWRSMLQDHTQAAATVPIGLAVCWYHGRLILEEARRSGIAARTATAQRLIGYLSAGLGLGALFFGIGGVLSTVLRMVLVPSVLGTGWRDPLSFNLALAIAALPVFVYATGVNERRAAHATGEERALARRIYLYAALLFGVIATIVAVVALARISIAGVFLGAPALDLWTQIGRWLGYALMGVAIAGSYLRLLRRAGATGEPSAEHSIAIVADEQLLRLLNAALARELPGTTIRGLDPKQLTGSEDGLAGADILIASLAAALEPEVSRRLQTFGGRRLLLATPVATCELVGARRSEAALVRDTVRLVREEPPAVAPAAPPPAASAAALA